MATGCGTSNPPAPPTIGGLAVDPGSATAVLTGHTPGDQAGWALAAAGDTNGDGFADLLVGAAYAHDPTGDVVDAEYGEGAAYLLHGPITGAVDLADADAVLWGTGDNHTTGRSVSGSGDIDGDGLDDVVVGAMHVDHDGLDDAGAAYVLLGPLAGAVDLDQADAVILGADSIDHTGSALAIAGDGDGDGHSDIIVGAHLRDDGYPHTGEAWLLRGPLEGVVAGEPVWIDEIAVAALQAEALSDYLAYAVAGLGDVTGDGLDDVGVGAPFHAANDGAAYVVPGNVTATANVADLAAAKLSGPAGGASIAGVAVAGAGDPDGDGYGDVLVGAIESDRAGPDTGAAYLARGPFEADLELERAHAVVMGGHDNDKLGFRLGGAGDVDSDGFGDLLVGAPLASYDAPHAGAAYLIPGPIEGWNAADAVAGLRVTGGEPYAFLSTVAAVGDLDGDGRVDLAFGAHGAAEAAGTVLIVAGSRL